MQQDQPRAFVSRAAQLAMKADSERIATDFNRRKRELAAGRCDCGAPLAVGSGVVPEVRYTCRHAVAL